MAPRPDVSEKRIAQILNAAQAVFAQKGFHQARMEDIADRAEVSKGTLYLYFKSKDDLIVRLLDRLFQRELRDLADLQYASGTASERLWQFSEGVIANLNSWLNLVPIAYEFLGVIFRRKLVQQAFRQYFRSYLELILPIIQQGIDRGEFRRQNAEDVAIAAGAIFEGTILLWVYDSESVDVAKHIRAGMRILLEGIKA